MASRREFLKGSAAVLAGSALLPKGGSLLHASPMSQPLGFQAFEIIEYLAKDWDGTWKTMAGMGYKFVDLVKFGGRNAPELGQKTAKEISASLKNAGLKVYNHHFSYSAWTELFAETIEFAHTLGVESVVCSPGPRRKTVEDWKWMAGELNTIGAKVQKEGLFVGYHNHEIEFRAIDGQRPWDILMANTDPKLVKFQIDVGNLTFGGADAAHYLAAYPDRYFSMHVKDFKPGKASVPVGKGILDWNKIFALGKKAGIKSYVAEVGAYGANTLEGTPLEPAELDILESFRQSFLYMDAYKDS
ncbi:MAG: TIM barrel protein [Candidatus Korobacteraceae bacterium]